MSSMNPIANLADAWKALWNRIQVGPPDTPGMIEIPATNILNQTDGLDIKFKRDQDYFQVVINEMYLTAGRRWFDRIAPAVFVVSDFTYNGEELTNPIFIGPSRIQKLHTEKQPKGVIYRDYGLGLYPYRGGGLKLYIVLCEVGVGDAAPKRLLRIVESTAKALDFSPALSPYTNVASLVMDGFKELVDAKGINPLISVNHPFGANINIPFKPSFFVLLDDPNIDPKSLWVDNRRLMQGKNSHHLTPFRDTGYVLYSIVRPDDNKRDDLQSLAFHSLWERVKEEANGSTEREHENARVLMADLYQMIMTSPELTEPQANELADKYPKDMEAYIDRAIRRGLRTETRETEDKLYSIRDKALSIAKKARTT